MDGRCCEEGDTDGRVFDDCWATGVSPRFALAECDADTSQSLATTKRPMITLNIISAKSCHLVFAVVGLSRSIGLSSAYSGSALSSSASLVDGVCGVRAILIKKKIQDSPKEEYSWPVRTFLSSTSFAL